MYNNESQDFQQKLLQLTNDRLYACKYCDTAFAMLVYDYLLTLGQEVDLIWPTPWSLTKLLFFLTRYSAFLDASILTYYDFAPPNTSPRTCASLFVATKWLNISGIAIAELVLAFHTWILWRKSRYLGIGLLFLWFSLAMIAIIPSSYSLRRVKFELSPNEQIERCWQPKPLHGPAWTLDFVTIVVFETAVLALTMYKGPRYLRHNPSNLLMTLYQDGIVYYLYLMGFSLVNVILHGKNVEAGFSLSQLQRVLHPILTGRILLNLRESVKLDHARMLVITGENNPPGVGKSWSQGTRLSTVILGENTWFCDRDTSRSSRQTASVDL